MGEKRHLTLAEAMNYALDMYGEDVLGRPSALLGFMMDCMDPASTELRVLERNLDGDLLLPFRETLSSPAPDLQVALARCRLLLISERMVDENAARQTAEGIAEGIANWRGVPFVRRSDTLFSVQARGNESCEDSGFDSFGFGAICDPLPTEYNPVQCGDIKASSDVLATGGKFRFARNQIAICIFAACVMVFFGVLIVSSFWRGEQGKRDWDKLADEEQLGDSAVQVVTAYRDVNDLSTISDFVDVALGPRYIVGLRANGTVVGAGLNNYGSDYGRLNVGGWTDIVDVAVGERHVVGLKSDGTVVAVGDNTFNQCDVAEWTGVTSIAAGQYCTVGLRKDGTVCIASPTQMTEYQSVSKWTDIKAIAVGSEHVVGLKTNGSVVAVAHGFGHGDECDVSSWTGIDSIAAGSQQTIGIRSNGTVVAAGDNDYGQCEVSDWAGIVAVDTGENATVGVKSDGSVVFASRDDCTSSWKLSEDWKNVTSVSVGYGHFVALCSDGTLKFAGDYYSALR